MISNKKGGSWKEQITEQDLGHYPSGSIDMANLPIVGNTLVFGADTLYFVDSAPGGTDILIGADVPATINNIITSGNIPADISLTVDPDVSTQINIEHIAVMDVTNNGFVVSSTGQNVNSITLTGGTAAEDGDWDSISLTKVKTSPPEITIEPNAAGSGFLGHFDSTITDDGPTGHTLTPMAHASISATQSKFGGSSLYLDTHATPDDYVTIPSSDDFTFDGDFTIDSWVYLPDLTDGHDLFGMHTPNRTTGTGTYVEFQSTEIVNRIGGTNPLGTITYTVPTLEWFHFALVRNNGVVTMYINGTSVASGADSNTLTSNSVLEIGRAGVTGTTMLDDGYIDEFRIVKGIAAWTADFTPPTQAYTLSDMESGTTKTRLQSSEVLTKNQPVSLINAGNNGYTDGLLGDVSVIDGGGLVGSNDPFGDGSLDAKYQFENNISDSTGNYADGTAVGTPTYSPAKLKNGIDLNGTSQYIHYFGGASVTDIAPVWGARTAMSWGGWVKTSSTSQVYVIDAGGWLTMLRIQADGTVNTNMFDDAGSANIVTNETVNDGQWHHIVCTWDTTIASGKIFVYIDGVEATYSITNNRGLALSGGATQPLPFRAGVDYLTTSFAPVSLDQIEFYTKALSSNEVQQLFTQSYEIYNADISHLDLADVPSRAFKYDETSVSVAIEKRGTSGSTPLTVTAGSTNINLQTTQELINTDTVIIEDDLGIVHDNVAVTANGGTVAGTIDSLTVGTATAIATYNLDGDATDLSGNYNGTTTDVTYGAGKYGQYIGATADAYNFYASGFASGAIKSYSFWHFGSNSTTEQGIGGQNLTGASTSAHMATNILNNSIRTLNTSGLTWTERGINILNGQWNHIVVSFNGSTLDIYVNNTSYLGVVTTTAQSTDTYFSTYAIESLDQLRIFDRALTSTEVTSLYNENHTIYNSTIADITNTPVKAHKKATIEASSRIVNESKIPLTIQYGDDGIGLNNPSAVDAVPALTAAAQGEFSSNDDPGITDAYMAFDDSTGYWLTQSSNITGYIGYTFATAKIINKYTITTGTYTDQMPNSWQLQGTNNVVTDSTSADAATWSDIDTAISGETAWSSETRTFTVTNRVPYKSYRLLITANDGNALKLGLQGLEFIETLGTGSLSDGSKLVTTEAITTGDKIVVNSIEAAAGNVSQTNVDETSINPFFDGSLVAKYLFNSDLTDETGVYDMTGAPTATYPTGKYGTGVSIADTDGSASTGITHKGKTICGWFRTPTTAISQNVLGTTGSNFAIEFISQTLTVYPAVQGPQSGTLTLNTWYHFAVWLSDGDCKLWINGADPITTTNNVTDGVMSIGDFSGGSGLSDSILDHVEIYNRELTTLEVQNIYNNTFSSRYETQLTNHTALNTMPMSAYKKGSQQVDFVPAESLSIHDDTTAGSFESTSAVNSGDQVTLYNSTDGYITGKLGTVTIGSTVDPNVSLLAHFDGTYDDVSLNAHSILTSGVNLSFNVTSKFGGQSLYFGSNDSFLYTSNHTDFQFGTGDFTIDFWFRWEGTVFDNNVMFTNGDATLDAGKTIYIGSASGGTEVSARVGNGASLTFTAPTKSTWMHLALVRTAGVVKFFTDGVQRGGDQANTDDLSPTNLLSIGAYRNNNAPSLYFTGFMDELRVVKGVAEWTTDFTPPTAAYDGALPKNTFDISATGDGTDFSAQGLTLAPTSAYKGRPHNSVKLTDKQAQKLSAGDKLKIQVP